jgi:hypothetical protein
MAVVFNVIFLVISSIPTQAPNLFYLMAVNIFINIFGVVFATGEVRFLRGLDSTLTVMHVVYSLECLLLPPNFQRYQRETSSVVSTSTAGVPADASWWGMLRFDDHNACERYRRRSRSNEH